MPTLPEETVTAAAANRGFSKLLEGVRQGRSYVVTSHGRPVARVVPAGDEGRVSPEIVKARLEHLAELAKQPALNLPRISREEFYEEMLSEPFAPQQP